MLTSINPLGQRARGHRWATTVAVLIVASTVGGAMTGAVLGALGALVALPVWLGAAGCAVALVLDLVHRAPSGRRQVDEDWLVRYRPWVYAVGFGWQLGTGVVTIVTSAATYALLLLLVVVGLPWAVVAGAVFGLVRALPLLAARSADSPERLRRLARRLDRGTAPAARVTTAVLAAATLALVTA
jgi:hypothetical protein